jgi:hypothetical protein
LKAFEVATCRPTVEARQRGKARIDAQNWRALALQCCQTIFKPKIPIWANFGKAKQQLQKRLSNNGVGYLMGRHTFIVWV